MNALAYRTALPITPNGKGLARATGWSRARMVLSAYYGPERCYIRHQTGLVAVCRPTAARRGVLYGPADAWGRRLILAQAATLSEVIQAGNRRDGRP